MAKELKGAELLEVGTWEGVEGGRVSFSPDDLDAMVASFQLLNLRGRVPLKFGHDADHRTDGQPAYGWVDRLYREGAKLMADFSGIPDRVYEMIKESMYKYVSIEALRNTKAGNRTIPWILDAVALLGADQPAVGTLKDLQSLTLRRKPAFAGGAAVRLSQGRKLNTGDHTDMDEKQIQEMIDKATKPLTEQLATATANVAKLSKDNDDLVKLNRKVTIEAARAAVKKPFEDAIKAETLLPAKREQFFKFARVEDDEAVLLIKAEDVTAYIKDNAVEPKKKQQTQSGGGDAVKFGATNALEVHRQTKAEAVANGYKADDPEALRKATSVVLSRDKKLAHAYIHDPLGEYKPDEAA